MSLGLLVLLVLLVLLGLGFLLAFVLLSRSRVKPLGLSLAQSMGGLLVCGGFFMAFTMEGYSLDAPGSAVPASATAYGGSAATPIHTSHSAADFVLRWDWLPNIEAGPWAVLIMLVVGVFLISRFQFSAQRSVAVELPQTEPPFNYGWLILPVSCLAGLGYLAMPAFRPAPRLDTARVDQQFFTRQQRMEKVLRETIDGSGRPGDEIQNIPDWLKNRSTTNDQILLTSEQFSTRKEAEDELLPFAAHLLQRTFHETHPWQGAWNVPLAQVRERVVAQQFYEQRKMTTGKFSGEIYRLHMLVNVSPSVAETFTENWKSQIVEHRLQVLGVLFGWLTCVLFTGSVFYRRAAHPENSLGWVHHLKLSGVTVGLTAAAAWVLMTQVG